MITKQINSIQPAISVVVPVYNSENVLDQCVNSLLNQTLKNVEFIFVDDGSIDNSFSKLCEYQKRDNRISLFKQENKGAGAARNLGLRHAKGEYLSILDSDDFYEFDMLEKAYQKAKESDSDVVVFRSDNFISSKQKFTPLNYSIKTKLLPSQRPFNSKDVEKDIFKLFVGWSWDKLFKTSFIKDNNIWFQEQRTTNDMLFVFSAIIKASKIDVLENDILAHHRREEGSLSVTREKSWHCFHDALISLRDKLIEWELFDYFEQDYLNYCIHFSLWNLDTLKEPTYELLYNKLKDEWFAEFGVVNHPMDFYYNRHEYLRFQNILNHPFDWNPNKIESKEMNKLENKSIFYRGLKCLKENGFEYTIKNIIRKIRGLK